MTSPAITADPKPNGALSSLGAILKTLSPEDRALLAAAAGKPAGDDAAVDDGRITPAMRRAFLDPKAIRPQTEIYHVSEVYGPPSLTLQLARVQDMGEGVRVNDGSNLTYQFAAPNHRMGTELWVKNRGYHVTMIDITDHPEVRIDEKTIAACRESGYRLPEGIKPQNSTGHFDLNDVRFALKTEAAGFFEFRRIGKNDGHARVMDGETFRQWYAKKAAMLEAAEQDARESRQTHDGIDRLSAITGNMPALAGA